MQKKVSSVSESNVEYETGSYNDGNVYYQQSKSKASNLLQEGEVYTHEAYTCINVDFKYVEALNLTLSNSTFAKLVCEEEYDYDIGDLGLVLNNTKLSTLGNAMANGYAYVGLGAGNLQLGKNKILIYVDTGDKDTSYEKIYDVDVTLPSSYLPSVTNLKYETKADYYQTSAHQYGEYDYMDDDNLTKLTYIHNSITDTQLSTNSEDMANYNNLYPDNKAQYDNIKAYADKYSNPIGMNLTYRVKVNFDVTYKFSLEKITFDINYNNTVSLNSLFNRTQSGSTITLTPYAIYDKDNPLQATQITIKPLFGDAFEGYGLQEKPIEVSYTTDSMYLTGVTKAPTYDDNNIPSFVYKAPTSPCKVEEDTWYTVSNQTIKEMKITVTTNSYHVYHQYEIWGDGLRTESLPTFDPSSKMCQTIFNDAWSGNINEAAEIANNWQSVYSTWGEILGKPAGLKIAKYKEYAHYWTFYNITVQEENYTLKDVNGKTTNGNFTTDINYILTGDMAVTYLDKYPLSVVNPDKNVKYIQGNLESGNINFETITGSDGKEYKVACLYLPHYRESGDQDAYNISHGGRCVPTSVTCTNKNKDGGDETLKKRNENLLTWYFG